MVTFKESGITVISVYAQNYNGARWRTPLHVLTARERIPNCVLVGDMNLHHPAWDVHGRQSTGVEVLTELASKWDLTLLTPKGEPTRL